MGEILVKKMMRNSSRLYIDGKILGYKRSLKNQYSQTSLIKADGVESRRNADFFFGKRVAFVYKARKFKVGTKFRCIWGKVTRAHGNSGILRSKFRKNLPPSSRGSNCRIMLYPCNTGY